MVQHDDGPRYLGGHVLLLRAETGHEMFGNVHSFISFPLAHKLEIVEGKLYLNSSV